MNEAVNIPTDCGVMASAMELLQEGVFIVRSGRFVFGNAAASGIIGCARDELAGVPLLDVVHPDDRDGVQRCCVAHEAGDETADPVSFRIVQPTGEVRDVSVRMQVQHSGADGMLLVGSVQDLTASRKTEEALDHARAAYEAILETLPDIYYRTDREGRILTISTAIERVSGYAPEEMVGEKMGSFDVDEIDRSIVLKKLLEARGDTVRVEARMRRKDGDIIWISSNARALLDDRGEIAGIERVSRDISEEVAALRLADQANRAKSDFVANVSHELRTPLNAIIGYAEFSLEDGNDVSRKFSSRILQSAHHLLGLVDDLLDVSRIETGNLKISPTQYPVASDLVLVSEMVSPEYEEAGVNLSVEIEGLDTDTVISADRRRVRQILLNLLSNARKYSPEGGLVRLRATGADGHLEVRVIDEGEGIQPEDMERVFDRFAQIEDRHGVNVGGTGIGLPISRELAQLHGGTLHLESRPGEGVEAVLKLPDCLSRDATVIGLPLEPVEAIQWDPQRRPTILVAEDNPVNSELMQELLGRLGCIVETAEDGVEAYRAVGGKAYDLVFMDIQMPRMDGVEAVRWIREHESMAGDGRRVPILALTAHGHTDRSQLYLASGMDGHLTKPVSRKQIEHALAHWIGGAGGPGDGQAEEPAADKAEGAMLDQAVIDDILESSGVDKLVQLTSRVAGETEAAFEAMNAALQGGDNDTVYREVHRLKGAYLALGAARMPELARKVEAHAQAGEQTELSEGLVALRSVCEMTGKAWRELAEPGAAV